MQESVIRHPEKSFFVMRRDWQVLAMNQDRPQTGRKKDSIGDAGAELLSIFEYHYNNRYAHPVLKTEMSRALQKGPRKLHPNGDWLPYPMSYLKKTLLDARSPTTIALAIDHLEKIGFISTKCPKDIREAYASTYTWIRFMPDVINQWIEDNCVKTWIRDWTPADRPYRAPNQNLPEVLDPETDEKIDNPNELKSQAAMVNALCEFHRHIHGKNKNTIYDNKRKRKVADRIIERMKILDDKKERVFSDEEILGQCAMVIIGNRFSDWHQGRDEQNVKHKVYDDIELMFRDAKKFENHMEYSEAKGVTWEVAYTEFAGFLNAMPSQYAKGSAKNDSGASIGQIDAFQALSKTDQTRYRDFSRAISSFFLSNMEAKDVLEFAKTNDSIAKYANGIVSAPALAIAIEAATKVFRPNGVPKEIVGRIEKFAKIFAKIQQANQR